MKVLIVDSDSRYKEGLRRALEGHEILEAGDIVTARKLFLAHILEHKDMAIITVDATVHGSENDGQADTTALVHWMLSKRSSVIVLALTNDLPKRSALIAAGCSAGCSKSDPISLITAYLSD